MIELMHTYPAVTWLLLAATSCLGFLAVISLAETIIYPRSCKRKQDV